MLSEWIRNLQSTITRGSQIRYGEDELYDEMKDTCRQHSQLPSQPNSQRVIIPTGYTERVELVEQ